MDLIVFGDSIAKGVVYDENKGRYVFSPNSFLSLISQRGYAVVKDLSRFGCTTVKGEAILDRHLDELSSYDYTLLEFGGNDCDLDWKKASEDPDTPQTGQVDKKAFMENYIRIIDKVKENGGTPVLTTLPPLDPEKFFEWVAKDLDKCSVMRFLKNDKSNIYRWQEEYSDLVTEIGGLTGAPVLDIRRPFLESSSYGDMLSKDGMHPNEAGHKAIASFLEDEWLSPAGESSSILGWEDLLPFEFAC